MRYNPASRTRYRRLVAVGTGLVTSGSLLATGALVAVAENETAAKQARLDAEKGAAAATPVVEVTRDRPYRTKVQVITKPGTGGAVASGRTAQPTRTITRVVRRTTTSSGS